MVIITVAAHQRSFAASALPERRTHAYHKAYPDGSFQGIEGGISTNLDVGSDLRIVGRL
jgi:hypothetical protein